jgi:hypothetical protein
MGAKDILLKPIDRKDADKLVKRVHYSGKVVNNSQLSIGVFYQGRLEGAMQFGPSLDKRKIQGLVSGTLWHEFIELNRMAFTDVLPRNSESRAIAIAFKLLRKHAPQLKWVITFADGTQCGDGTIYRAAGFHLTSIKANNQIWVAPDGEKTTRIGSDDTRRPERGRLLDKIEAGTRFSRTSLTDGRSKGQQAKARTLSRGDATKGGNVLETGAASMKPFIEAGFKPLDGYQLRYIYFLDPSYKDRLTVPILPYSRIQELGAGMYRGEKIDARLSSNSKTPIDQIGDSGANPTQTLDTPHTPDTHEIAF